MDSGWNWNPYRGQCAVLDSHDRAVLGPRGHAQVFREAAPYGTERVVAPAHDRRRQPIERTTPVVVHETRTAVQRRLVDLERAADGLDERLVAEADPEDRRISGECAGGVPGRRPHPPAGQVPD